MAYTMLSDKIVLRERFRLRRMAALASVQGTLLDVGFAQCPNPYLKAGSVIGVDPHARECPDKYDGLIRGTLSDCMDRYGEGFAQALVAGELVEHLPDPLGFLRECFDALAPGGKLVVSTPNPNSPIERMLTLTLNRRLFYTQEHIFIFPQRWLIRAVELAGFQDVELHSGGFPVPFFGLVPFPRPWCYQTIALAIKPYESPC